MNYQNNFPVNVLMFVQRPLCKYIDPDKITLGAELRIKSAYNHISPVPGEVSGLLISIPVLISNSAQLFCKLLAKIQSFPELKWKL